MPNLRILVVEDEGIVAKDIQDMLKGLGYSVPAIAFSGEQAIKKAGEIHPDLVLMDIKLKGGMDGTEAARQIRSRFDIPVVYLTAYADKDTLERAKITEPFGYILKPFKEIELYTTIQIALYKHKIERKLKESEQWFTETFRCIGDAVIATDEKGVIIFTNLVAEALTGWKRENACGKDLAEVFNIINEKTRKPLKNSVIKVLRGGSIVSLTNKNKLITKDGAEIPIDATAAPIKDINGKITGVVLAFRDITEHKKAEEREKELAVAAAEAEARKKRAAELEAAYRELRETQAKLIQAGKMAALGTLGAGIAHQLNQPLAGIRGFTQAVLMQIDKKSPFYEDLKEIEEQTGYMSDIITNISGFARQAEFKKQPIDINEPIEKALQLLSEQLRLHGIKLVKNLNPKLPKVNVDANQMQQVFINFITNAREALDDLPKEAVKELIITTSLVHRLSSVLISFTDTGQGIPNDIKDRIFEPFFTTKGPRSTGLGLSLNYGMIQDHGGTIEFESEKGKGATFIIRLPAFIGEIAKVTAKKKHSRKVKGVAKDG